MSEVKCSTCKGTKRIEFEQGQRCVPCVTCSGSGVDWRKTCEAAQSQLAMAEREIEIAAEQVCGLEDQLDALREELATLRDQHAEQSCVFCNNSGELLTEVKSLKQCLADAERRNADQLKLISLIRKTIPAAGMGASWSVDLCDRIDRLINPQPARCMSCDRATVEQCDDAGCGFLGAGNGAPEEKPTESGASE